VGTVAVLADGHRSKRGSLALADLTGQPLYVWSLRTLAALRGVASLTLLAPAPLAARVAGELPTIDGLALGVVPVGEDRATAYLRALDGVLAALPATISIVALHDVTIPVVEAEYWAQALAEVDDWTACAAAQPVHDTIKLARRDSTVYATPPRAELRSIQTPLLVSRAALRGGLAQPTAEDAAAASQATRWLPVLVSRLLATHGVQLRLVPAGANSVPVRSTRDLSVAARWVTDAGSAPG
jgi:2-C-methyl-D-erythritol 4-phosphate cytidylyltransferase